MVDWAEPGAHEAADGVFRVPLSMPERRPARGQRLCAGDRRRAGPGRRRLAHPDRSRRARLGAGRRRSRRRLDPRRLRDPHPPRPLHARRRAEAPVRHAGPPGPGRGSGAPQLLEIASNVPVTSLHQLRRSGEDELAAVVEAMAEGEEFDADGWEKPDSGSTPASTPWAPGSWRPWRRPVTPRAISSTTTSTPGSSSPATTCCPRSPRPSGSSSGSGTSRWPATSPRWRPCWQRPDARLLPAHGAPGPSAHARATELLEHHDVRLAETLRVLDELGETAPASRSPGS